MIHYVKVSRPDGSTDVRLSEEKENLPTSSDLGVNEDIVRGGSFDSRDDMPSWLT